MASATASETRWASPPEMRRGRWWRRCPSPSSSRRSRARAAGRPPPASSIARLDVLDGGEERDEVAALHHHPDPAGPQPRAVGVVERGELPAVEDDPAGVRPQQPGEHRQERRLAAPRRPHEARRLAAPELEGQAAQHGRLPGAVVVGLADRLDPHEGVRVRPGELGHALQSAPRRGGAPEHVGLHLPGVRVELEHLRAELGQPARAELRRVDQLLRLLLAALVARLGQDPPTPGA